MAAVEAEAAPAAAPVRAPAGTARKDSDHLRVVARGGSWNLVGAGINVVLSMAVVVIVARCFSVTDAGVFWAAVSLFLILESLSRLGADTGLTYFIPRMRPTPGGREIPQLLRHALTGPAVAAACTGVALFLLAPWVATHVLGAGSSAVAVSALRVMAVILPVACAYNIVQAATRGFGSMRPTVLNDKIGRPLGQTLCILLVVALGAGALALSIAWVTPFVPALVTAALFLRRQMRADRARRLSVTAPAPQVLAGTGAGTVARSHHREEPPAGSPTFGLPARPRAAHWPAVPALGRRFWVYTAPRGMAAMFQVATQRLGVVLIAALVGPPAAAVFAAVSRLLVLGQTAVLAIQQPMAPKVSELLGKGNSSATREVYRASTAWLILISWPVYLLLAVQGAPALSVFGHNYAKHATVLSLLALGMLYAAACGPVDVLLLMAGQSRRSLVNRFLALVVMVAASVALIPALGLNGAAIAWGASLMAANTAALIQVQRLLGLHPFGPATLWSIALTVGCFGAVSGLALLVFGPGLIGLTVSLTAGAALYLPALWRWRSVFQLDLLSASLWRQRRV